MYRLSVLASLLLVFTQAAASAEQADSNSLGSICQLAGECDVHYETLAEQDTHPFLFYGVVVDRGHPRWREFAPAIRRYSSARDCLLRSEKADEHPDLRQFDWQKPRKLSEIDVCLFRVFATLESPQKIALWLTGFGFTVSELTDHINHSAIPDEIDPTKGIDAAADQAIYRRLRPSLQARVLGLDTARAFTIAIRFNDDLKLLHVSSGVVVE